MAALDYKAHQAKQTIQHIQLPASVQQTFFASNDRVCAQNHTVCDAESNDSVLTVTHCSVVSLCNTVRPGARAVTAGHASPNVASGTATLE